MATVLTPSTISGPVQVAVEMMLDTHDRSQTGASNLEDDYGVEPSEEGKRRYPPDGRYYGIRCTCKDDCPPDCKGECGCNACVSAYGDFLGEDR